MTFKILSTIVVYELNRSRMQDKQGQSLYLMAETSVSLHSAQ